MVVSHRDRLTSAAPAVFSFAHGGPPLSLTATTPASTLPAYTPPPTGWDEAVGPDGQPRPTWRSFLAGLDDLDPRELGRRWRDAQHIIRENGITYNVYGDSPGRGAGVTRLWDLDPIPLLISPGEAAILDAGLVQRARLLDLVARDLYGPQRLIADGFLPPELIYANPGFLRACHGVDLPGHRHLHLYGANLGRGADGGWHVLGDRTQAPSGPGYALENRIVLARTLPEAFRDCKVIRLASFFRAFKDAMRAIAPGAKDNPRVVLLTPGPRNETYFEHAYLARYLGYTLVEGGDLTVRDNRVFLKVLGGLQPVDVIFRRLDDDFCDPLELRPDSILGVPGLMNAVRAGNVVVGNALGSGVLETPALLAYLPRLCRELLAEELRLPSVPTWWCGEPESLAHVLAHLPDMLVKSAFPAVRVEPEFPGEMSTAERADLVARLTARPRDFVAQDRLGLSTAPTLIGDRLEPRYTVVRKYVTADGDGYMVMPGGLTRVSTAADTSVVSMQRGGGSKDTWVMSASGAVNAFSLLRAGGEAVPISRAGGDLSSRAADNLFWLGRYAERAEAMTRLLRGILTRLAESSGPDDFPELPALFDALTLRCPPRAGVEPPDAAAILDDPETHVFAFIFDADRPGGLGPTLANLLRVSGTARDLISTDMWRVINRLSDFPTDPAELGSDDPTLGDVLDLLNQTVVTLAAFGGLAIESMTRGEGWRFLDMGRRLERCLHLLDLLGGTLVMPTEPEGPVLEAVLDVADSTMTYRRRYMGSIHAEAVIDLLVADETNPRSLASHLLALVDDVNHLPRSDPHASRGPEQRLALSALSTVQLVEPARLSATASTGERAGLRRLFEDVGTVLPALSEAITQQYLSHLQTSRHLAGERQT